MHHHSAQRSRWFADLVEAIDRAQEVAWRLGVVDGDSAEAIRLYARLESIRAEAASLRADPRSATSDEVNLRWIRNQLSEISLIAS